VRSARSRRAPKDLSGCRSSLPLICKHLCFLSVFASKCARPPLEQYRHDQPSGVEATCPETSAGNHLATLAAAATRLTKRHRLASSLRGYYLSEDRVTGHRTSYVGLFRLMEHLFCKEFSISD
jgi:hypothetical protein